MPPHTSCGHSLGQGARWSSVCQRCDGHLQEGFELGSGLGQRARSTGLDFPNLRPDDPVASDRAEVLCLPLGDGTLGWVDCETFSVLSMTSGLLLELHVTQKV